MTRYCPTIYDIDCCDQLAARAESPGVEFITHDGKSYKFRKTNKMAGNQRWELVDESNLQKVAEIQVSLKEFFSCIIHWSSFYSQVLWMISFPHYVTPFLIQNKRNHKLQMSLGDSSPDGQ